MNLSFIEKIVLNYLEKNPQIVEKLVEKLLERLMEALTAPGSPVKA